MKTKFNETLILYGENILINIMRTFIFLCCMVTFAFSPKAGFSQDAKIVIDSDAELTVEEIFDLIQKQTNHAFIYRSDLFANAPKVKVKKGIVNANDLLKKSLMFGNFGFKFSNGGAIILNKKSFKATIEIQEVITGLITDKKGVPLPGANIIEKGTTNGTQSDFDGKFAISVADKNAVLVISYIGFSSKEILVGTQTDLTVVLEEDAQSLEEIVIVGYGTQKKSDVTGAMSIVAAKEIQKIPTGDVATALQGQASGVNISSATGAPGSNPIIRIRGLGTIGNNDPLFIIDGIPGDLSFLNPADIQSINVLKDASAATIYGSRASNGVVIITTKRGQSGEPKVVINSYVGTHTLTNNISLANKVQHNQIMRTSRINAGETPFDYTQDDNKYADSDWGDAFTKTGFEQKHDVSITGGTEKMTYSFSGGYFKNSGTVINSDYERLNTRLNLDFKLFNDRLKITPSVSFTRKNINNFNDNTGGGNAGFSPFLDAYSQLPHKEIYDVNALNGFAALPETGFNASSSGNPVGVRSLVTDKSQDDYLQFNIMADLKITQNLSYQFQFGSNISNAYNFFHAPAYNFGPQSLNEDPSISEFRERTNQWAINNTLNYIKSFGVHNIKVLAGISKEETTYRAVGGANNKLPSNSLQALSAGIGDESSFGFNATNTLLSYFGRINYNFDGKYFFQSSIRRDGSSRFAKANKFGNFYSVSGGWAVHKEDFFNSNTVSLLKPRISYGILGNQNIGNHLFLARIGSGGNALNYPLGGGIEQAVAIGAISTSLPTPDIKWEETATTNFGLDLGFMQNRLLLSLDYFTAKTSDMLVSVPVPASSGITTFPLTNGGEMENKGWEFSAVYRNNDGDFKYDITGNLSGSKNKITKLGFADEAFTDGFIEFNNFPTTRTEVGGEVGRFYLFKSDGIFQNQAEIDAHGVQPTAAPGDLRFVDTNGDGNLDDDDKQFFDSALPKLEYGLTFNASYKDFDFSIFFQGTHGNNMYNGMKMWLYRTDRQNVSSDLVNAWTPQNTGTTIPRSVFGDPNNNIRPSDYFLEDASYLRLKNIQVGYSLPENILDKFLLSRARIYVSGYNLLTITDYSGFDPGITNTGLFSRGVDRGFYPLSKSFNLGITLEF